MANEPDETKQSNENFIQYWTFDEQTFRKKLVKYCLAFDLQKLIFLSYFLFTAMKQRYVVAVMTFFALGVTFSLRLSFSLVLTQMVYVPNASENNQTDSNGEEICPIKDPVTPSNVSAHLVRKLK